VILAAGLLVLLGLGLFIAGVLSGVTVLYWGCVAVCVVAAVLLFVARKRLSAPVAEVAATRTGKQSGSVPAEPSAEMSAAQTPPPVAAGATAAPVAEAAAVAEDLPDPPVEEVEVTDLLVVVDLKDEVLVIDEHPRYHLAGCRHLTGRTPIPLPLDEARTDGFTPCAVCSPDRTLAQRARDRR